MIDKWIRLYGSAKFECPICDYQIDLYYHLDKLKNFRHCPYCGERLEPPEMYEEANESPS